MIYLILSILCSASLILILRLFDNWKIKTSHGIVFNYLVCCVFGLFFVDKFPTPTEYFSWNGWYLCILLGALFYVVFNTTGKATTILGVATTSLLFKISFVLTVVVAIFFLGDVVTWNKIVGIICAMLAVFLITYSNDTTSKIEKGNKSTIIFMSLFVFIGSGLCDVGFNLVRIFFIPIHLEHIATISIFLGAFLTSAILNINDKSLFQWKNVAGGLLLGIPNYGSLYFWIQALKILKLKWNWDSTTLFPINNIGVVCLSMLVGFLIFKEQFSLRKIVGFALAIISIIFIGFIK